MRVSLNAKERAISVEKGEVYFQVHHDASRAVRGLRRKAIAWSISEREFSLRVERQDVKVALFEGRVRFDPDAQANAKPKVLTPGDVLIASVDHVSVKKEPIHDLLASLAWRQGMLVFHEHCAGRRGRGVQSLQPDQDRASRIRAPATETINGMLPINNLAEFARMAKNLFGLRAENREDEILLTR